MFSISKISLIIIVSIAALFCTTQKAVADSDGMFCHGNGYIAYELRHFDSTGIHTLYILKPSSSADTVVSVESYLIPEVIGQVHSLICEANKSVLISAFNTASRFDLSEQTFMADQKPIKTTKQRHLDMKSYGHISPVMILPDWGTDIHQYELHQLHYMFPEKGSHNGVIEHHSINRIVRVGREGHYIDGSYIFAERMKIETID